MLLALLGVLVVVAGLAIGLGTQQVGGVAEDIDRVDDPFPAEQDQQDRARPRALRAVPRPVAATGRRLRGGRCVAVSSVGLSCHRAPQVTSSTACLAPQPSHSSYTRC